MAITRDLPKHSDRALVKQLHQSINPDYTWAWFETRRRAVSGQRSGGNKVAMAIILQAYKSDFEYFEQCFPDAPLSELFLASSRLVYSIF